MDVRQKLALIPRPIVKLVPRKLRDQLRTRMLERERERRRRERQRDVPTSTTPLSRIGQRLDAVESKLDALLARIDDLQKGVEQLDARLSSDRSGDAPSVVDDLRELVGPIEELSRQLRGPRPDSDLPTTETHHAAH